MNCPVLSEFTVDELLDELARRYAKNTKHISTSDLVAELTTREGVDVAFADLHEKVRCCIEGPAIILTVFD